MSEPPNQLRGATLAVGTLYREDSVGMGWPVSQSGRGGGASAAEKAEIAVRVDPPPIASIIPSTPFQGADALWKRRMIGNVAAAAALFAYSRGAAADSARSADGFLETGRRDPA